MDRRRFLIGGLATLGAARAAIAQTCAAVPLATSTEY
jgi:hypothetical protein